MADKIKSFKDLIVWKKSIALVKMTYALTRTFPPDERFGLTAQLRRAAVSVPSNIAEGQSRNGKGEFIQFLSYAEGSLAELETQFIIAVELGFLKSDAARDIFLHVEEVHKMCNALRRSLTRPPQLSRHSPLATNFPPSHE